MSQRDFSWGKVTSSSDNCNLGSSMMHLSKRPFDNQWLILTELSNYRINLTHLENFI